MLNAKLKEVINCMHILTYSRKEDISELDLRRVLSEHMGGLEDFHQTTLIDMMQSWTDPESSKEFRRFKIEHVVRVLKSLEIKTEDGVKLDVAETELGT